jgi:hypothetical protein
VAPFLYVRQIEGQRPDLIAIDENLSKPGDIPVGSRAFTLSNVRGYYPNWVNPAWLKSFPISDTEVIYEINSPVPSSNLSESP